MKDRDRPGCVTKQAEVKMVKAEAWQHRKPDLEAEEVM